MSNLDPMTNSKKESEIYHFIIDAEHAALRADGVLSQLFEEASRSYVQKLIEGGRVFCNGLPLMSKKQKLKEGDRIELHLPPAAVCEAVPQDIPLQIVYEDEHVIVVNKEKGMVVHPGAGNADGTLVNALLHHCGTLSSINGVERPGIVHRIDKDTSGLLVCAKTDLAHRGLSEQMAAHACSRQYRGIAFYRFREEAGTVNTPIGRDPNNRLRMAVNHAGKPAVTHWRISEEFKDFTEIRARLETGRTHQIRVHMASIHHPLLGDTVYGPQKQPFGAIGQMLHAELLGFVHPASGQAMEFRADPPQEYLKILEQLRKRT